jgi:subtilisin family serine protease
MRGTDHVKRWLLIGGYLWGALAGILNALPAAEAQGSASMRVPGQYIVVLKDQASASEAAAVGLSQRYGVDVLGVFPEGLKGVVARVPSTRLWALAGDPRVRYIEQDQVVFTTAQSLPTGINRIDADLSSTRAGDGLGAFLNVPVAVIDTGLQPSHPDLRVMGGVNYSSPISTKWNDGHGHGTHVAGIIGARDNGIGVVGVAPGTPLWAVKVLNDYGAGTWSAVIAGINWVTARSSTIKVANMSLGGGYSQAVNDAVTNAVNNGVVFVAAAGNEAADARYFSPGSCPAAITVAAMADSDGAPGGLGAGTIYGADDTFASFSNFGSLVDIVAPGVGILSTYKGSKYATLSGTSMATPHVAGAAALYLSTHPGATPAAVQAALTGAAQGTINGYPVLNVRGF